MDPFDHSNKKEYEEELRKQSPGTWPDTDLLNMSQFVNGESIIKSRDGSSITQFKNGSSIIKSRDGSYITRSINGESIIKSRDGSSITRFENGSSIIKSRDGSYITQSVNGASIIKSRDGSYITRFVNGESIIKSRDGSSITRFKNGSSIIKSRDGSYITRSINGESIIQSRDGYSITRFENGSAIIKSRDGFYEFENGPSFMTSGDGTPITQSEEGRLEGTWDITKHKDEIESEGVPSFDTGLDIEDLLNMSDMSGDGIESEKVQSIDTWPGKEDFLKMMITDESPDGIEYGEMTPSPFAQSSDNSAVILTMGAVIGVIGFILALFIVAKLRSRKKRNQRGVVPAVRADADPVTNRRTPPESAESDPQTNNLALPSYQESTLCNMNGHIINAPSPYSNPEDYKPRPETYNKNERKVCSKYVAPEMRTDLEFGNKSNRM